MTLHHLLPRYLTAVAFSKKNFVSPINWDPKEGRFYYKRAPHSTPMLILFHAYYLLFVLSFLQFVTTDMETSTYANTAAALIFFYNYLAGYAIAVFGLISDGHCVVPNAFLSFEESEKEKKAKRKRWLKIADFLLRLWPFGNISSSLMLTLLLVFQPELPPFPGYLFKYLCKSNPDFYTVLRIILPPYQVWFGYCLQSEMLYGSIFALQVPVLLLFRYMKDTVWNNISDLNRAIQQYKKVLVLQNIINRYYQSFYYGYVLKVVCCVNISTSYLIINLVRRSELGQNSLISLILFSYFLLSIAMIAAMCGIAGFANSKSQDLLARMKMSGYNRSPEWRMKIRSLNLVKIRMGANFVDCLTALTVLRFCVDQTVSLLLMHK